MLLLAGVVIPSVANAQTDPTPALATKPRVMILGNVYGGGELAQVIAPTKADAKAQLIQDADLADLFTTHADHVYTTYVHLGGNSEVYGRVFGGGKGQNDAAGESAGRVTGQTDVALDGATVWSEIFGGGQMADVRGNTLLHFKKGKAGHNAFGGGLGVLGKRDTDNNLVPLGTGDNLADNRYEPIASADIKLIPADYTLITDDNSTNLATLRGYYNTDGTIKNASHWMADKKTGESFVVFDGTEDSYTHYEFEKARTVNRDASGNPVKDTNGLYYTETNQYQPNKPEQLFSINHNIYGGGMTASKVEGKTFVHVNYGMVSEEMMDFTHNSQPVWTAVYNSIANAQFCVFGGGYGYYTDIYGDTNVTFDIEGSGGFKYLSQFKNAFVADESTWTSAENIYESAENAPYSHGAPGRSCMDIVGGGYNGRVLGTANVTVGGDVVVRKVYGGGYYASVANTNVHIKSGIFNRIYGGGMIGNVYGTATATFGQLFDGAHDTDIRNHNGNLLVKNAIYGGNDVSGTVGTTEPGSHTQTYGSVTYNVYNPVDDENHGIRMNIYGGLVIGDVFGAGNGNHPGYFNPDGVQFTQSQHPSENYRQLPNPGTKGSGLVYKYRPRTGRVVMTIHGNEGNTSTGDPNADKNSDKVRIWGRTFGGGNSCNVGVWDGTKDDTAESYDDVNPWHPGDNFLGEGTITMNIGSHVQFGNRNDSHTAPNGLFMGNSGENMVTQHLDKNEVSTYHWYYDENTGKYWPGFKVYDTDGNPINRQSGLKAFKAFINPILTWSDNVQLNIANNATDVWMSNFVGGGYRGSMKAFSHTGKFAYTLPRGVTVGHSVVGGAFNAHIVYRIFDVDGDGNYITDSNGNFKYRTNTDGLIEGADKDYLGVLHEDANNPTLITGILRYNYDGGILKSNAAGDEIRAGKVFKEYSTANGTPDNDNVIDFSGFDSDKGVRKYKDHALVQLNVNCQLDPIINGEGHVHGGNVYGGCFASGIVEGDAWTDYRGYIASKWYGNENFSGGDKMFGNAADYQNNFAMMAFGAGYGADTEMKGDVYLRVIYNKENNTGTYPCLYNVFGGSFQGKVDGNTNIYYNAGQQGLCVGGVYGGGSQGYVAGKSFVELAGGYIANVYGGAREANVGKGTHVWAYDGALRNWGDDLTTHDDAPLVVERMFGGSDVSGLIGFKDGATDVSDDAGRVVDAGWTAHFSASTWPEELYVNGHDGGLKKFDSYIQIGGTEHSNRGYPLVGQIYAGGNGENTDTEHGHILPGIDFALIELNDGNVMEAFGGGNKATVHKQNYILTNGQYAPVSEIALPNPLLTGILQNRVLRHVPDCYTLSGNTFTFKPYNVQRLFGGNNVADMAIQPKWNLKSGHLGSVYSGGNEGDMTHANGLVINVSSDNIHINNVFGGCRMANVQPTGTGSKNWAVEDSYGATVNILGGYINNVYGGNDVSGNVAHGTDVNISGSISGNVYGSGNGDYTYQWDSSVSKVTEAIDDDGNIYYKVPAKSEFGGTTTTDQVKKLLCINSYRPSVQKARLSLAGTDSKLAYVKGNVYCGGNASTVEGSGAFTKLHLGSHVVINGVFMGSDGRHFSSQEMIKAFEDKNGFDMTYRLSAAETVSGTGVVGDMSPYYDSMLALYMRAVEMMAEPKTISYDSNIQDAYIGMFCGGGDRGSMLVNKRVDMTIPAGITIYDKIVAGCSDANVTYESPKGAVTTIGGFMRPLFGNTDDDTRKFNYTVECGFTPKKMVVPDAIGSGVTVDGQQYTFEQAKAKKFLFDNFATVNGKPVYGVGCNIYGGCYRSGYVIGDIDLTIKSNMLKEALANKARLNASSEGEVPCFNIYGAGYDMASIVYGNVNITLDNSDASGNAPTDYANSHPSCNNIFGGGRNGYLVGNANINVKNGIVYRHVIGGSDAGYLYGNTQIAVGDPTSWKCKDTGTYTLNRSDKWNEDKANHDGSHPVTTSIKLMAGDVISDAMYQTLTDTYKTSTYFTANTTEGSMNWSNRQIYIGGGIYGGGYALATGSTIYAGDKTVRSYVADNVDPRFSPVNPLTGQKRADYGASETNFSGYGGNATIMVADATENITTGHDHITISTLVPTQKTGMTNKMGLFTRTSTSNTDALGNTIYTYNHQSYGAPEGSTEYYAISGQGGIYGDGHLSFVEGFRSADIQRYGYADYTPQSPKLLNTMQRMDLVRLKDCCVMLQGARDFATNAVDATTYSIARIRELKLESSINPESNLDAGSTTADAGSADRRHDNIRIRNYVGFFNNVHYIGCISTNDDFSSALRHNESGVKQSETYQNYKATNIATNYNYTTHEPYAEKYDAFKTRNLGTARNMIGINNGYTLKIQNVYTTLDADGTTVHDNTYYGPIVGVCEVKLLTLVQGEGGGYVYADNVHATAGNFLNTSGNFVFPGTVVGSGSTPQNIVDDCFPHHFGHEPASSAAKSRAGETDNHPAHYWYVEGNKYWFTNTITGYTSNNGEMKFNMDNVDQIIALSGTPKTSAVRVKSVTWKHDHTYTSPASCDLADNTKNYAFKLGVSDQVNYNENGGYYTLPRANSTLAADISYKTTNDNLRESPLLSMQLIDNVQNNGQGYYQAHLSQPCHVEIVLESGTEPNIYTYTVNVDIKYLQGPRVDGTVVIDNCALPGELIHAEVNDLNIETNEGMPVSGTAWEVNLGTETQPEWRLVTSSISHTQNEIIDLLAQHRYNGRQLRYIVKSSNLSFPVSVADNATMKTLSVHNYHDMKYVNDERGNMHVALNPQAGARLYIKDKAGWDAFVSYLNASAADNTLGIPVGMEGLKVYLQNDITLDAVPSISVPFKGELNGDGYSIVFSGSPVGSLFTAGKLADNAKIYNLGIVNGTNIKADGSATVENCFTTSGVVNDLKYGKKAYDLSHNYHTTDATGGYINGNRYAGDDWQYARLHDEDGRMLRTASPNYGSTVTHHNTAHTAAAIAEHDCLFFGQTLTPDGVAAKPYPQHLSDEQFDNAWTEANRVYETEGYYNSKTADKFYYNTAAWAMQPGLTAVRFDNTKTTGEQRVPAAIGAVEDVTRNLLVYEADNATPATGSKAFFHVKGSKGENAYNNTHGVYTLADMALVDAQDFNAPYAFTATKASYERTPEHFVETRGTAWESLCLPFAPATVKAVKNDVQKTITHFYGTNNTDNINGTSGVNGANNVSHEYWLRELIGSKVENNNHYAKFSRPVEPEVGYIAYRPYIVSFPGEKFYEFNLTGSTIRWEKENAVITVTDDAVKAVNKDNYTYTGAFKNETASESKYVLNSNGDAFVKNSVAIIPFRGYLSASSSGAKSRVVYIGSDYDDLMDGEETEQPFTPDGEKEAVFRISTRGREVTIISSEELQRPCYTAAGASLGMWMIPEGESHFTVPGPGIYILNGIKFVVK